MATATLLQRKARSVRVSKTETMLILRSYQAHPTSWSDVLEDMRQNVDQLPDDAKQLYQTGTLKKLRDRMSGKFGKLFSSPIQSINDADIRHEVSKIQTTERRLLQNTAGPAMDLDRRDEAIPPVVGPVENRSAIVENLSDPEEEVHPNHEPNEEPLEQPRQNQPRRRKRPLSALIRENHEEYNKFITKKMPRLLRALGLSSSDEEN